MRQHLRTTETGKSMFLHTQAALLFAHAALSYGVPRLNDVYRISR
jgi:hypothetical protein